MSLCGSSLLKIIVSIYNREHWTCFNFTAWSRSDQRWQKVPHKFALLSDGYFLIKSNPVVLVFSPLLVAFTLQTDTDVICCPHCLWHPHWHTTHACAVGILWTTWGASLTVLLLCLLCDTSLGMSWTVVCSLWQRAEQNCCIVVFALGFFMYSIAQMCLKVFLSHDQPCSVVTNHVWTSNISTGIQKYYVWWFGNDKHLTNMCAAIELQLQLRVLFSCLVCRAYRTHYQQQYCRLKRSRCGLSKLLLFSCLGLGGGRRAAPESPCQRDKHLKSCEPPGPGVGSMTRHCLNTSITATERRCQAHKQRHCHILHGHLYVLIHNVCAYECVQHLLFLYYVVCCHSRGSHIIIELVLTTRLLWYTTHGATQNRPVSPGLMRSSDVENEPRFGGRCHASAAHPSQIPNRFCSLA